MTTTLSCNFAAESNEQRNKRLAFVTNEILPLLAAMFPKSQGQLNGNIAGNAMAYAIMLKGFEGGLVIETISELAIREPERFAPTPQELRSLCLAKTNPAPVIEQKQAQFFVSMPAIEMQVCAEVLAGKVARNAAAIEKKIREIASSVCTRGGIVTGERGSFEHLNSIVGSM